MNTTKNNDNQIQYDFTSNKAHVWRLCDVGEHWVRTHPLHVPPSEAHPNGYMTTRHGHCAKNPSGHNDQLHLHEIQEIAEQNFADVESKPCSLSLNYPYFKQEYDDLIAGWTKYWNEVLHPAEPLDPNFVKALIATESSFNPNAMANKKNPKSARGLMQVTDSSRQILSDQKGELKKHFVIVSREDLNDPNINICAGIRWLFHKRKLLSSRLRREPTWEEVIFEYKGGRTKFTTKEKMKAIMTDLSETLRRYQKCEK